MSLGSSAAFSKGSTAMIGAESTQNAMRLTSQARVFFGGSSHAAAKPSFAESAENSKKALDACFDALKAWLKLFPALKGSPEYFEANIAIAELYSKCAALFFLEFKRTAQWGEKDFEELSFFEKKKALSWLAQRFMLYECAISHVLLARGCAPQVPLDQPLEDRTMWAYENAHNSARDLLRFGDGMLSEKAKESIDGKNISYKIEMHKYEHR